MHLPFISALQDVNTVWSPVLFLYSGQYGLGGFDSVTRTLNGSLLLVVFWKKAMETLPIDLRNLGCLVSESQGARKVVWRTPWRIWFMIQSVCSAPTVPFRLPASTSLLCILNRINTRKEPFEASAVQGEIILFGRGQPLGDVLRTGLAPTDFVGRLLCRCT